MGTLWSSPSFTSCPKPWLVSSVLIVDSKYTPNPNDNPFCNRRIRATRHREGDQGNVTVDVTVVDRCTGCKPFDLDFSPGAFELMADQSLGRVDVTWAFLT